MWICFKTDGHMPVDTNVSSSLLYHWLHQLVQQQELFSLVERRKEMFYLTTHSTHFIYGYMGSDTDSDRGNLLPPHGLLFLINSKGSFICTIPQTGLLIPRPLLHQSWSTDWNEK